LIWEQLWEMDWIFLLTVWKWANSRALKQCQCTVRHQVCLRCSEYYVRTVLSWKTERFFMFLVSQLSWFVFVSCFQKHKLINQTITSSIPSFCLKFRVIYKGFGLIYKGNYFQNLKRFFYFLKASNQKTKGTFFSPTLKLKEKKVPLFSWFEAKGLR
jgi:hypothetical protein